LIYPIPSIDGKTLASPKQIQIIWLTTIDNIPDALPQSKRT
jgi:hypothetical protein